MAFEVQRRKAVLAGAVDGATELAQRIDQVANRALVHACHAMQTSTRTHQRQGGSERAHGGAGIAHEQIQFINRCLPAQTGDADGAAVRHHSATHLAQGIQHDAGVVRVQQVMQSGRAFAQGGEQQHAV